MFIRNIARVIIAVLLSLITIPSFSGIIKTDEKISLEVSRSHGFYLVKGSFDVHDSSQAVWNVLSDYDHIPNFVSSVTSSKILERGRHALVIEQKMQGKIFLINRTFHVVLDIKERPFEKISFKDVSRKNFVFYAGSWSIVPIDNGSRILYHLKAKPTGWAPIILGQHVFNTNISQLLNQIRTEIIRRSDGV